ncbi:Clavaminate synthase-like protein At3g21360 [Linum grandiflorum]
MVIIFILFLIEKAPAVLTPSPPSSSLADFTSAVKSQTQYLESLLHKSGDSHSPQLPISTNSLNPWDSPTANMSAAQPIRSGGETPVVLSHLVHERMKEEFPEFVKKLEDEGQIGIRFLGADDDVSSAVAKQRAGG